MKKIFLIGFMGTGKTTVGRELAKKLTYAFIDLDKIIEKQFQKKIVNIFEEKGEKYFRDQETKMLQEVLKKELSQVIATGGGIVIKENNRKILKENGFIVWLKAKPETILKRVKDNHERPLLAVENKLETITKLLQERAVLYQQCADLAIDTDDKSVDEIIEEIVKSQS